MKPAIQDEFTHMDVSRQRKYQLRKQRDGLCTQCGAKSQAGGRCLKHLIRAREIQHIKQGAKRRYNSLSYRLANA